MPPSTTMMETTHANDVPKKKGDHSLRIDESTKRRLAQKSLARKQSDANASMRRSFLNESIGKWTDEPQMAKPSYKKRPSAAELSGISVSHHSGYANHGSESKYKKDTLSKSDHSRPARKKPPQKRASTPSKGGGLGSMLSKMDETQPRKKRDARTVASMPVTKADEEISRNSRRGRRSSDARSSETSIKSPRGRSAGPVKKHYPRNDPRSQSPSPLKKHYPRSQSPGAINPKKHHPRSQSPAARLAEEPYRPVQKKYVSPAKRRAATPERREVTPERSHHSRNSTPVTKRSSSPGPMKKRSSSPAPVKKRSVRQSAAAAPTRKPSADDDNEGKLGMMLNGMETKQPKRRDARSVASAPAQPMRKDSSARGQRTGSTRGGSTRGERTSTPKKSKSTSSRGGGDPASPRRMRRSRSADDVDLGVLEEHLNMSESARVAKNSQNVNNSRSQKSKKKSDRSEGTSTTQPDNSDSLEHDRRPQLSRRSNSMAPRVAVPSKKEEPVDRRAEMKRHRSMGNGAESHQQEEAPRPTRAQSMMLHRENTRRGGKSSSLADLVQYSEEEIHSTSYFASNHVLVNRERMKRGIRPLTRNIAMDEVARENAKAMAETTGVAPIKATYVGNVLRGESIRAIHRSTMQQKQGRERANLLNPYFQDFGVGTAKGKDGMLYMCQLFSERLELTCADAAPVSS